MLIIGAFIMTLEELIQGGKMKKIEISPNQIERAKNLYNFKVLKNSITNGAGNITGALGEVIVYDYYSNTSKVEYKGDFDNDLLINGYKIEVKSAKATREPTANGWVLVAERSRFQKCDYYIFTRVSQDLKTAWILGSKSKSGYYEQSEYVRKNDYCYKENCYRLQIKDLEKIK